MGEGLVQVEGSTPVSEYPMLLDIGEPGLEEGVFEDAPQRSPGRLGKLEDDPTLLVDDGDFELDFGHRRQPRVSASEFGKNRVPKAEASSQWPASLLAGQVGVNEV